jgi:hypothetical protein
MAQNYDLPNGSADVQTNLLTNISPALETIRSSFSGANPPTNPTPTGGQLYWDDGNGNLSVYNNLTSSWDLLLSGSLRWLNTADFDDFNQAVAQATTDDVPLVISNTTLMTGNLTVNIPLFPLYPGIIDSNGYTINITLPPIGNPTYQWLSGFGASSISGLKEIRTSWLNNTVSNIVGMVGATQTELIIDSAVDASSSAEAVTVPSTMAVKPLFPFVIDKGSATLLTINGLVVGNPMHKWLDGFAAGDVTGLKLAIPQWFGAVGDGVTDDLLAFQCARDSTKSLYIPPLTSGNYYKLSNALVIDIPSFTLHGDGVKSLLCAYNSAGYNAITVTALHVKIRDIGVTGTLSSGHLIQMGEVGNSAHHSSLSNIWLGWAGTNHLEIVEAISAVYTDVCIDNNNGYRPATIIGATEGGRQHGINIHRSGSGINNDQKFVNCTINSGISATGTELRIGIDGTGSFEMFEWIGGLIQGQPSGAKLIDIENASYCHFYGGDYEPNGGIAGVIDISGSYINFVDCLMQANLTFTNSSYCNIERSSVNHVKFTGCNNMSIEKTMYGTTGGQIEDLDGTAILRNLMNSSNVLHAIGYNLSKGQGEVYLEETMDYWKGGASPTEPSTCYREGGTLTQEGTIKQTGSYSAKLVAGSTTDYFTIYVDTTGVREVFVEAWVYNVSTAARAAITGDNGGAATAVTSNSSGVWEHMQVTFTPAVGATDLVLHFGANAAGTVYYDRIKIITPHIHRQVELGLNAAANPDLMLHSLPISSFVTTDTTTVTDFKWPLVGVAFTIRFLHSKTITNNTLIKLAGSVNFVGAVGDTLTLRYGTDGIYREIGRMVV